jgi:APA family basic amino acid/polyamine antiporter
VIAIAVQGVWAIVIALSGRYEQILNFMIGTDLIFFGLSATCIFIFRRRERLGLMPRDGESIYRTPGHPVTTITYIAVCWLVVAATFYHYPKDFLIGIAIALAGLPVYFIWAARKKANAAR